MTDELFAEKNSLDQVNIRVVDTIINIVKNDRTRRSDRIDGGRIGLFKQRKKAEITVLVADLFHFRETKNVVDSSKQ